MQIWGLCGCSAEDLIEYVPKKTSARKSSTVPMSSAHVCSVNLCGLTKIECIYLLSCMANVKSSPITCKVSQITYF